MPFEGRKFPSSDWWALLGKFKGRSSTPPSFVPLSLYRNRPPGVRHRCLTQAHPSALRGQRHIPVVSLFACMPDPHSWGPAPAPAGWPPHLQTRNRWRRSSAAGAAGCGAGWACSRPATRSRCYGAADKARGALSSGPGLALPDGLGSQEHWWYGPRGGGSARAIWGYLQQEIKRNALFSTDLSSS